MIGFCVPTNKWIGSFNTNMPYYSDFHWIAFIANGFVVCVCALVFELLMRKKNCMGMGGYSRETEAPSIQSFTVISETHVNSVIHYRRTHTHT